MARRIGFLDRFGWDFLANLFAALIINNLVGTSAVNGNGLWKESSCGIQVC